MTHLPAAKETRSQRPKASLFCSRVKGNGSSRHSAAPLHAGIEKKYRLIGHLSLSIVRSGRGRVGWGSISGRWCGAHFNPFDNGIPRSCRSRLSSFHSGSSVCEWKLLSAVARRYREEGGALRVKILSSPCTTGAPERSMKHDAADDGHDGDHGDEEEEIRGGFADSRVIRTKKEEGESRRGSEFDNV